MVCEEPTFSPLPNLHVQRTSKLRQELDEAKRQSDSLENELNNERQRMTAIEENLTVQRKKLESVNLIQERLRSKLDSPQLERYQSEYTEALEKGLLSADLSSFGLGDLHDMKKTLMATIERIERHETRRVRALLKHLGQ